MEEEGKKSSESEDHQKQDDFFTPPSSYTFLSSAMKDSNENRLNCYETFTRWCKSFFYVSPTVPPSLESRMFRLISREENIANTFKNLDVVKINSNQPVIVEVTRLITELEKASKQDSTNDTFLFANQPVEHKDRFSLLRLNLQFHEEASEWEEALYEHISAKKDAIEKRYHVCHLLQQAISEMKTIEEVKRIAFHLMNEACLIKGGVRFIDISKLQLLLDHPCVKTSYILRENILEVAKVIQSHAIRKKQSNIVWKAMTDKIDKVNWDKAAHQQKEEAPYNLEGIFIISELAGIDREKIDRFKLEIEEALWNPNHVLKKMLSEFDDLVWSMEELNKSFKISYSSSLV